MLDKYVLQYHHMLYYFRIDHILIAFFIYYISQYTSNNSYFKIDEISIAKL